GDVRRFSRMLLECNSNDKLCAISSLSHLPAVLLPVLFVFHWWVVLQMATIPGLHINNLWGVHLSGLMHHIHLFLLVTKKNQQEPCSTEKCYIQLGESSVESLLSSASLTLKELEIPREKLLPDTLQLIKLGAYGSIYRAQLETGSSGRTKAVVLKALQDPASPQEIKDFLGRIKFHQNLGHHENLVELVGCCVDQLPLYMIMEDVSLGDLLTFLWTCRKDVMAMDGVPYDLTERQVYEVGQQAAAALAYLEEKNLFHGDIAARNVLLHQNFTAKLCGLGMAYESHTHGASSVTRRVPVKWQAPERLLSKPPTIKADIWSFGILLYEMITLG
ncbi:STYK1 kinase, partial [Leiothrix lutea]|nr:STYK1 kinase [Leiothrix lutea]